MPTYIPTKIILTIFTKSPSLHPFSTTVTMFTKCREIWLLKILQNEISPNKANHYAKLNFNWSSNSNWNFELKPQLLRLWLWLVIYFLWFSFSCWYFFAATHATVDRRDVSKSWYKMERLLTVDANLELIKLLCNPNFVDILRCRLEFFLMFCHSGKISIQFTVPLHGIIDIYLFIYVCLSVVEPPRLQNIFLLFWGLVN